MYTFSFIVGNIIPKSVKCIHSATKNWGSGCNQGYEEKKCKRPSTKYKGGCQNYGPFLVP